MIEKYRLKLSVTEVTPTLKNLFTYDSSAKNDIKHYILTEQQTTVC